MDKVTNSIQALQETVGNPLTLGEDYAEVLQHYKLSYHISDYYLQVGEITQVQGWILHVSVIISQLNALLHTILPALRQEQVPFKIGMNKATCNNLLLGYLGKSQVGKIICIYPENETTALNLAEKIITLTRDFKGPAVPTDICLKNIVYTRYGSFNPVMLPDKNGKEVRHIYDNKGQLVQDTYTIPFQLPKGIRWPFGSLASPVAPARKKILKHVYKPLTVIKSDLKGDVWKGIHLKNLFKIVPCVIKQGRKHMISEDQGRDMYDRLQWQQDLYHKLSTDIPLPEVFDLFQEDEDNYLIMEFIDGISFHSFRKQLNPNYRDWSLFTLEEKKRLLNYLIRVVNIIQRLHERGYVHRDIAPNNFLIDKKEQIYLIDIELAYCLAENKPHPPFQLGTPGFMSPEQQLTLTPTLKEDVYGIGAFITEMLTGLSTTRLDNANAETFYKNIFFFIQHAGICNTLTASLNPDPALRSNLRDIQQSVERYAVDLCTASNAIQNETTKPVDSAELADVITRSLKGLNEAPIVTLDGMWYSKINTTDSSAPIQNLEYTRYTGMREGLAGVLYVLAKAKKLGLDISNNMNGYANSWNFIEDNLLSQSPQVAPGLYDGAAGVALALSTGMECGLVENNGANQAKLLQYLSVQTQELNIATGIAGQGVALLQSITLAGTAADKLLADVVSTLLQKQLPDGMWSAGGKEKQKRAFDISFASGSTGITWFLLAYLSKHPDEAVKRSAQKALTFIAKQTHDLNDLFNDKAFQKLLSGTEKGDERKGVILTFLKAYEVLGDVHYKNVVEAALRRYPVRILKNDFTQESGIAGLGEIYLEAFRILKNEEWKERAEWIANVFIHTLFKGDDHSGYWIMEENNAVVTADLMVGMSGIIHFLLRCMAPEEVGYRLIG